MSEPVTIEYSENMEKMTAIPAQLLIDMGKHEKVMFEKSKETFETKQNTLLKSLEANTKAPPGFLKPAISTVVYVDGAFKWSTMVGGWASIILEDGYVSVLHGARTVETDKLPPTNNRMELLAAIKALNVLPSGSHVEVYSDSKYVVNGAMHGLSKWISNGGVTTQGTATRNMDLWKELAAALAGKFVTFVHVNGHAGNHWNEQCDYIADRISSFPDNYKEERHFIVSMSEFSDIGIEKLMTQPHLTNGHP